MIISAIVVLLTLASAYAQEQKQNVNAIKVSGSLTFATQTNSLFTGGRFSDKPALNANLTATYKNFAFGVSRNSDLLDSKSGANLFAFSPSFSKSWGKYHLYTAVEVNLFDYVKEFNLVAPYFVMSRSGFLHTNLMGGYARTFNGTDVWLARCGLGKNFSNGYAVNLYGWVVDWGGVNYSLAGEISKSLSKNVNLLVYYHLNNFTNKDQHQEFGAIRIRYKF